MATNDSIETKVLNFIRERIASKVELSLEEVTRDSALVDLGLQSIDAVIVCGEVEDEFGIEIDPSEIFEHDTLGTFADEIIALVVENQ